MHNDQEILNSETIKTKFLENRNKIRFFVESNFTPPSQSKPINIAKSTAAQANKAENDKLKKIIAEFYQVQKDFHRNMHNMVQAFASTNNQLPDEYKYFLIELLTPYRNLTNNLFAGPTGEVENDIANIMQVINAQNEQFKNALEAFLDSASNLSVFNKFLNELQKDTQFVINLKAALGCQSWLNVESNVDNPFQNLIRYELLLRTIYKCLLENKSITAPNLLKNVCNSLDYLVTEVNNINENKETILLLNKIEMALGVLLADAILKNERALDEKMGDLSLKEQIEFVMLCVKMGKNKIIQNEQDISSLYEGLLELLNNIIERYPQPSKSISEYLFSKATALGYSILSFPVAFFRNNDNNKLKQLDPLSDIQDIIKELNEILEQSEALKTIHGNLLKKNA